MNVLEKILEDVEKLEDPYYKDYVDRKHVAEIICSHMDEIQKCGECSKRKWYQKGFEDGKKDNDWIPVEERLPDEYDGLVLAQVSGKPKENITLDNALELAVHIPREGWILEEYPEWEKPNVIAWQPLPEPYKDGRER